VLVDREPAVLVVEHRIREDRLCQRVDTGRPVAPEHVGERHIRVRLGDSGGVEPHRGTPVRSLDAEALLDLVEDGLGDLVARAEGVGELGALRVQEHGPVRAGGLRDGVPRRARRPGAAVRVVLERVEVARLGADPERDLGDLAGRPRMVGRELATLLRFAEAAAACGEDHGAGLDRVLAAACAPARRRRLQLDQGSPAEDQRARALHGLPERARDREAGSISDLEEALPARAPAPGEPVATVRTGELDALLFEPVDRRGRLRGEHADEVEVGRLVRAPPHVLGVDLRGVVLAEGGLDAALGLRRVARLNGALGGQGHTRARSRRRDRSREPRGAAADHEHVDGDGLAHDGGTIPPVF
jgi:hypothetical protein